MKMLAVSLLIILGVTQNPLLGAEVVTKENAVKAFRDYRLASNLIAEIHNDLMMAGLNVAPGDEFEIPKARVEDYKRARKLLEQSIVHNPYFPDAYLLLANSYWEIENDLKKTIEYYNKALEVDPDYDAVISARAGVYILLNRVDAAEKDLERLVALKSDFADSIREEIDRVKNKDEDE